MPDLFVIDASWLTIAYCFVAIFLGGFVKGVAGIGLPLISVPLLALAVGLPVAVSLLTIPIILSNIWQGVQGGRLVPTARRFGLVALALALGIVLGVQGLARMDDGLLSAIAGIAVILAVIVSWARPTVRIPPERERSLGILVGAVGGLMGGLSSFFGPPLIVYLMGLRLDKDDFVAAIAFLFFCGGVPLTTSLLLFGVMSAHDLLVAALAMIPTGLGLLAGQNVRAWMDAKLFLNVVYVVMLLTGLSLLAKAL